MLNTHMRSNFTIDKKLVIWSLDRVMEALYMTKTQNNSELQISRVEMIMRKFMIGVTWRTLIITNLVLGTLIMRIMSKYTHPKIENLIMIYTRIDHHSQIRITKNINSLQLEIFGNRVLIDSWVPSQWKNKNKFPSEMWMMSFQ